MTYNAKANPTYSGKDHLAVNTGYTSVISASGQVEYPACKGFLMGPDAEIFITASDGTKSLIPVGSNETIGIVPISIIGYNTAAGGATGANVTLLY